AIADSRRADLDKHLPGTRSRRGHVPGQAQGPAIDEFVPSHPAFTSGLPARAGSAVLSPGSAVAVHRDTAITPASTRKTEASAQLSPTPCASQPIEAGPSR